MISPCPLCALWLTVFIHLKTGIKVNGNDGTDAKACGKGLAGKIRTLECESVCFPDLP
jgi:hypothetical protein